MFSYPDDKIAGWWIVGYTIIAFILTYLYYEKMRVKTARGVLTTQTQGGVLWGLVILLAIFIGSRPLFTRLFSDSMGYANNFINFGGLDISERVGSRGDNDQGFQYFTAWCYKFLDAHGYFTAIALVYFGFAAWMSKAVFKGNAMGAFLMYVGAFSTFSYVTNGLRSGMAASFCFLGLGVLLSRKGGFKILVALFFLGLGTQFHNSAKLTAVAILGGFIMSKWKGSPKVMYAYYLLCFVLYLTMHGTIETMMSEISFDNDHRYQDYLASDSEDGYYTGFRADFLLYSLMPIVLGWYVLFKKKLRSKPYEALLYAYIIANGFWVMLMEASFSNRFAYLSWCLYPFVLGYPCLRMNVWGRDQGKNGGFIILAQVGFSVFMDFVYYGKLGLVMN